MYIYTKTHTYYISRELTSLRANTCGIYARVAYICSADLVYGVGQPQSAPHSQQFRFAVSFSGRPTSNQRTTNPDLEITESARRPPFPTATTTTTILPFTYIVCRPNPHTDAHTHANTLFEPAILPSASRRREKPSLFRNQIGVAIIYRVYFPLPRAFGYT